MMSERTGLMSEVLTQPPRRCEAALILGELTFRCYRAQGHEGNHKISGVSGKHFYEVEWTEVQDHRGGTPQ